MTPSSPILRLAADPLQLGTQLPQWKGREPIPHVPENDRHLHDENKYNIASKMGIRYSVFRTSPSPSQTSQNQLNRLGGLPWQVGGFRRKDIPCSDHSPFKGTSLVTAPSPELTPHPPPHPHHKELVFECLSVTASSRCFPYSGLNFLSPPPPGQPLEFPDLILMETFLWESAAFLNNTYCFNSRGLSFQEWKEVGKKPERNLRKLETSEGQT